MAKRKKNYVDGVAGISRATVEEDNRRVFLTIRRAESAMGEQCQLTCDSALRLAELLRDAAERAKEDTDG